MRLGLTETAKRIKSCKKKVRLSGTLFGGLVLQVCFLICVTTLSC